MNPEHHVVDQPDIPLPPLPPADIEVETDPSFSLRTISKTYRAQILTELARQHEAGVSGIRVVTYCTRQVDRLLDYLFVSATRLYARRNPRLQQRCAVFAQGGYGRAELNPYSDIDLLFLYHWKVNPYVETVCEELYYSLMDGGFTIGHAFRNVRECVRLASQDLQVKTSLIDCRFLCGDEQLAREFTVALEREIISKHTDRFFQEKARESQERHRHYGDSIYLLEPQLKEGKGGLRDFHTANWLAKVKYKVQDLRELVTKGVVSAATLDEIDEARNFLWRARNGLHLHERSHQDLLTFERQEYLAPTLGFADVASFMRDYYRHATTIFTFSHSMQERCLTTPKFYSFLGRPRGRDIREGVRIVDGTLLITKGEILTEEPTNLLTIFHDAQRHEVRLADVTRQLLRDTIPQLPDSLRDAPELRQVLFAILGWKHRVAPTLYEMNTLGVLGWLLPEFGRLRWQIQRELYHVYTVDEHSLRGVVEMERMRDGEYKKDHPLLTQVIREIEKIELLFLAMLYHDVGKGYGHDHDERGAAMTRETAVRWRLSPDDTDEWHFLVQHHLRMSYVSQRQDLSDDAIINDFARFVRTPALLKKLYLLTFADMKAVGPKVWNPWKGELLDDLYLRTLEQLETGVSVEDDRDARLQRSKERTARALIASAASAPEAIAAFLATMPDNYLLSTPEDAIPGHFQLVTRFLQDGDNGTPGHYRSALVHFPEREFSELTIVTHDRPGLFAMLTGILAAAGLNIAGARITTSRDGIALDVFQLSHVHRLEVITDVDTWSPIYQRLGEVLSGKRTLEDLLRAAQSAALFSKRAGRYATEVTVDNTSSPRYTVIDVTAPDRMGLLFTVTYALFQRGLEIHLAKITTNVDYVLDVFFVTDRNGAKVANPEQVAAGVRQQLLGGGANGNVITDGRATVNP